MKKNSAISDEEIVSALLSCRTQGQAAEQLGINRRQLYERMQSDGFKALYTAYKLDILKRIVDNMTALQTKAIKVYDDVLSDPDADINAKLKAADAVMKHFFTYKHSIEEEEEKISKYRYSAENKILIDSFSF